MIETIKRIIKALRKIKEENMAERQERIDECSARDVCPVCGASLIVVNVISNKMTCPKCGWDDRQS